MFANEMHILPDEHPEDSVEQDQTTQETSPNAEITPSQPTPEAPSDVPTAVESEIEATAESVDTAPPQDDTTVDPPAEAVEEEAVSAVEEVVEQQVVEETPESVPADIEKPITEAEVAVAQETVALEASSAEETAGELTVEESQPAEPTIPTEEGAVSAEEEVSGVAHVSTVEEILVSNTVLSKLDQALEDKEKEAEHMTEVTPEDMIQALLYFHQQEDVKPFSPKVGLIKRTFDGLSATTEMPNDLVENFRFALNQFNEKRNSQQAVFEKEKVQNSHKKKELLEALKVIVESKDATRINEVRDIQEAWKGIGHVPKAEVEELYQQYRRSLDEFYRLREMHREMMEYDRKINLQEKDRLILEAGNLIPSEEEQLNPDVWKVRMDQLTELQRQWRSVGHVPREDMDRVNTQYREAIDKFFEVRQVFQKHMEASREENGEKKKGILEKMLPFATFTAEKPRKWNEATAELRVHQDEWKALGQAPKSINGELWHKYREVCNAFFSNKAAFFKKLDEERAANLEVKRGMVEKAEALSASMDWDTAARELKELQKEWKSIGPVPERYSNKLWNRFRAACDAFFENRRKHYHSQHSEEYDNLDKKKELISKVVALREDNTTEVDDAIQQIKGIQAKWKEIGKVPYKEKDKIWDEFRKEIDTFFNQLSLKREELKDVKLKASLNMMNDPDKKVRHLKNHISRLRKKIQQSKDKVDQYSTNIQYISKGKSGDALRSQIQQEIDKEKEVIVGLKDKLKELNELLKNPPKEEVAPLPAETPVAEATETPSAEATATEEVVKEEKSVETESVETPTSEEVTIEQSLAETESVEEAVEIEETPVAEASEPDAQAEEVAEAPAAAKSETTEEENKEG
ncbi:MAG: DUF349 domain-containing protein [Bacteroidota bacterium]